MYSFSRKEGQWLVSLSARKRNFVWKERWLVRKRFFIFFVSLKFSVSGQRKNYIFLTNDLERHWKTKVFSSMNSPRNQLRAYLNKNIRFSSVSLKQKYTVLSNRTRNWGHLEISEARPPREDSLPQDYPLETIQILLGQILLKDLRSRTYRVQVWKSNVLYTIGTIIKEMFPTWVTRRL